jgi:hypothetical protein
MAYIGKTPVVGNFQACDAISTSATDTFNLLVGGVAIFPQTAQHCLVSLNGVLQAPISSYTISGSTIVFASALTSADSIDFITILGDTLDLGTPSDSTVTTAKVADGAVDLTSKVTGALPVANGGTALTSGFANGITEADMFRLTADTNQNTAGFVTSNWERVDTDGFGKIGTGLTESSGVFSFPSTGIYLITGFANMDVDGGDTNAIWELYTTADNSSYDIAAAMGTGEGSGTDIRSLSTIIFQLDVTNTTNVKFKWGTSGFSASTQLRGNTALNETCFSCIRLGDT